MKQEARSREQEEFDATPEEIREILGLIDAICDRCDRVEKLTDSALRKTRELRVATGGENHGSNRDQNDQA